jgi:uncharacterized protein (DUF2141 family)
MINMQLLHVLLLLGFWGSAPAEKSNLTVVIENVKAQGGTIRVAVFKQGQKFPEATPAQAKVFSDDTKKVSLSVEPGWYAVAVYHDQNNNGQLDKKIFGIPKEPYGFSNNIRPTVSAPKFDECKIQVQGEDKVITIKLL